MMEKPEEIEELDLCTCCGSETIRPLERANNIWTCDTCGYIFLNPQPIVLGSKIDTHGDREIKEENFWSDEKKEIENETTDGRLKLLLDFVKEGFLLNIGSEDGESFLKHSKEYFKTENMDVKTANDSVLAERPDVITLFDVLDKISMPMDFVKQCYDDLKDGGYIMITLPNDVSFWKKLKKGVLSSLRFGDIQDYGFRTDNKKMMSKNAEIRLSYFRPETLRYLINKAGFNTVYQGPDPYLKAIETKEILALKYFSLVNLIFRKNLANRQILIAKK